MKYTTFILTVGALLAVAPVDAQTSRHNKGAQQEQAAEAKSGVRFVICSAKNARIKSPLWYQVNEEEARTIAISARTASPRVKPIKGKVVFYEDNPIPPEDEEAAKEWKKPKEVFSVDTTGAASKAFCIVFPGDDTADNKVKTIMLNESDFPRKGVHLINLSKKMVRVSISEKGDFTDEKSKVLKGGILYSVTDDNKWSMTGASHGDTLAFQVTYKGKKKVRKTDKKGKTIKDDKGKPVMETVETELPLRRSRFVVSEKQSLISIVVDDPAHDGVKLLSIQLTD